MPSQGIGTWIPWNWLVACAVLPTLPSLWWDGCICFPALAWVVNVSTWPLKKTVELGALLSRQFDAQACDEGLHCHGNGQLGITDRKFRRRWRVFVDRLHVLL